MPCDLSPVIQRACEDMRRGADPGQRLDFLRQDLYARRSARRMVRMGIVFTAVFVLWKLAQIGLAFRLGPLAAFGAVLGLGHAIFPAGGTYLLYRALRRKGGADA